MATEMPHPIHRVTGLGLLFAVAGVSTACEHRGGVILSSTSPRETYRVTLTGHLHKPMVPGDEHLVRVTARRGDALLVLNHEIHFADWFDESFVEDHGPASWSAENILRFRAPLPEKGRAISILVRNDSNRTVSFLKVVYEGQLFLFFELAPGSRTAVPASPGWDSVASPWVSVDAVVDPRLPIRTVGDNFDVPPNAKSCEYEVVVSNDRLSVRPKCQS